MASEPTPASVSPKDTTNNTTTTTGGLHITLEKGKISPKNHEVEHREHYVPPADIQTPPAGAEEGQTALQEAEAAWFRIRRYLQDPFSEFCGTFVLILFGDGSVAQVVLSGGTKGDYQSISWGWG